jgi:hypothetical protein
LVAQHAYKTSLGVGACYSTPMPEFFFFIILQIAHPLFFFFKEANYAPLVNSVSDDYRGDLKIMLGIFFFTKTYFF